MGIYDNSLFDAPSQTGYDTFQQQLLEQRRQLEQARPDVAAQMPVIGANTPGQQMFQAQQQQPADQLASGVQQLSNMITQATVPTGAEKKDIKAIQEQNQGLINMALDQVNPLKPKELWGPDVGKYLGMPQNSGGILGLGITPIDVLLHAVGAGLTSRLPQEQAMAMTMKIGGLARDFRANQEKSATDFINQIQQGMAIQNTTTHMGLLQDQAKLNQEKQQAIDVAGLLTDNGRKVPASILIRAGVPAAVALGAQTGHWSILNTADGLVAVNTADPTKTFNLGLSKGNTGGATPYADIQKAAIAANLRPGTADYQKYVTDQLAAQSGAKAGANAAAQAPFQINLVDQRAKATRGTIDYRLRALGNAPITEKTAALWVDGNGTIIPTKDLLGKQPQDLLEQYPDAVKLASTQERGQLASATSLVHLRDKIAPLLPKILTKYGGQSLTDILSVQGNRLNVKLKGAGGDPDVARLNALLTDFLVETPLAMGMVAGREGPELLKRYEAGMPGMGSTVQSAISAMNANIESVATRWAARGINIMEAGAGRPQGGAAPAQGLSPEGNAFLQELKKAMGK